MTVYFFYILDHPQNNYLQQICRMKEKQNTKADTGTIGANRFWTPNKMLGGTKYIYSIQDGKG